MVQLSLEELKSVLKLLKEKKKRRKRRKANKRKRQLTSGYELGGMKSDSSHLKQGYSIDMPFSKTSNESTELMALQRNILENQLKNPDRFDRQPARSNLLTNEDFRQTMNLFGSQLGSYYDTRLNALEDRANQLSSDLGYSVADFIRNRQNRAYIEQLPEEEDLRQFNPMDGIDVAVTEGSDAFRDMGNQVPYAEIEAENPFMVQSPIYEPKDIMPTTKVQEPYFENTDIYGVPSYEKAEKQTMEETPTPKPKKGIMKKISQYFTPSEPEPATTQPGPIKKLPIFGETITISVPSKSIKKRETTEPIEPVEPVETRRPLEPRKAVELSRVEDFDTDWYKQNIPDIIQIEQTDGFPKGDAGDKRFRQLFSSIGVPSQDIDEFIDKSKYTKKRDLYRQVYMKVRANNNKILKRLNKENK